MIVIKEDELINSTAYVREPVDKEVNEILSSEKSRIILSGDYRGTGRTTVLHALETRGVGSKTQTICIAPDRVGSGRCIDEEVQEYYTELIFSLYILGYISAYYPIAFEKHFKKDYESINNYLKLYHDYMNKCLFDNSVKLDLVYKAKELSSVIIDRLRNVFEIEKLNIAIDGFDSIRGSEEFYQRAYANYFDLFDKVILISDDQNLNKDRLTKKGYEIKELNYGMDKDVLREIVRRRIKYQNKNSSNKMELNYYTQPKLIESLAKLGPNIDFAFSVIEDIKGQRKWYEGIDKSFEELYEKAVKTQTDEYEEARKRGKGKTLYL